MEQWLIFPLRGALIFSIAATAHASVSDWQAATSSHPNLLHQYSFDGMTDEERTSDLKGTADLALRVFGSGTADQLQLGMAGFDSSSNAAQTHRGPGTDNAEGAYLRADSITLGDSVSYEIPFFRPLPRKSPEASGILAISFRHAREMTGDIF